MLLAWQSKSMPVMHIVFNNSTAVDYILLSASLLSAWLPAEGWSHGMLKLWIKLKKSSLVLGGQGREEQSLHFLFCFKSQELGDRFERSIKVLTVHGKSPHAFMKDFFTMRVTDHWNSCREMLWRYPKAICTQSWVTCSRGPVWAGRLDQITSSGPF